MQRSCDTCVHRFTQDDGYSNYTVTGTTFNCLLDKHPGAPFDVWYAEPRYEFALQCDSYEEGFGIHWAVEMDDADYDSEDLARVESWRNAV